MGTFSIHSKGRQVYGRLFLLLTMIFIFGQVYGQEVRIEVTGKIVDKKTNEPIEFATIQFPDYSLGAVTDTKGNFRIPHVKPGEYTIEISYVGYQKYTARVKVQKNMKPLLIQLDALTLALDEVVVTAQNQKTGSTSKIGQAAIQHIQPKSVEDMLQLLPGNLTKNPTLNTAGQAYIREISSNNNNSLGVSVLVDGAPVSNDANLQTLSSSKSASSIAQSVSGKGTDLRTISPDNIESVEVIRGIPSVEYGNLTSGAILIKTRSGVTPWEARFKADPFSKMIYAGKGFRISEQLGVMNLALDYSQSYTDIRKKYNGFDRITANLGYSNIFMRNTQPLTFNLHLAYFNNINSEKSDPQLKKEERIKNRNTGLRAGIDGNWNLNKSWISNIGYSFMVNYNHQRDSRREQIILQSGITPIGKSYESKEYQTIFLNSSYYSDYVIDGKPLDVFLQLKGSKLFQFTENFFMSLKGGVEWKYNANKGEGMTFDTQYPPSVNDIQSIRPRSFKSIPAMKSLSYYIEDKIQLPLSTTTLTVQGGARFTHLFLDAQQAGQENMFIVEPRINLEYSFLNASNNTIFDNLTLTGGYGVASKLPTLLHLYPDNAYFDEISFSRMFADDLSRSLAVVTTKVIDDTYNPELKPSYSYKAEVGLSGRIGRRNVAITFFHEKYKDEFGFKGVLVTMPFRRYVVPEGIESVSYQNNQVVYRQNGIEQAASVTLDTTLYTYNTPVNNYKTIKKGIEYNFDLGQIPMLRTSVVIDGAWLYIKRYSTLPTYKKINTTYEQKIYPYLAVMPGGNGTVEQRGNTNVRLITHIPALKLIFSTTAQIVWGETSQTIYEDESGKDYFYKAIDPNGKDQTERYFVNPIGFIDHEGHFNEWKAEYQNEYKYRLMLDQYNHTNTFGKEKYPVTCILNFRLTKELGQILEFSFTANNFLKFAKTYKNKTSTSYKELNIPLYFGAEIKLKF